MRRGQVIKNKFLDFCKSIKLKTIYGWQFFYYPFFLFPSLSPSLFLHFINLVCILFLLLISKIILGTLNREKSKTSGSSQGSHHTNNNQYMYQTDMYDGYTITPLHDAPKASIYGTAADVVYGTTYGYGVYTGPPANVHGNGGGMADYGGIVVPNGRTSVVSPPRHEEFSHLDYGVVTQSDLEYAASDLADEESGNVKPSDNSSSTLPTFTNSIRGSTLSLNSAKKKNITQV